MSSSPVNGSMPSAGSSALVLYQTPQRSAHDLVQSGVQEQHRCVKSWLNQFSVINSKLQDAKSWTYYIISTIRSSYSTNTVIEELSSHIDKKSQIEANVLALRIAATQNSAEAIASLEDLEQQALQTYRIVQALFRDSYTVNAHKALQCTKFWLSSTMSTSDERALIHHWATLGYKLLEQPHPEKFLLEVDGSDVVLQQSSLFKSQNDLPNQLKNLLLCLKDGHHTQGISLKNLFYIRCLTGQICANYTHHLSSKLDYTPEIVRRCFEAFATTEEIILKRLHLNNSHIDIDNLSTIDDDCKKFFVDNPQFYVHSLELLAHIKKLPYPQDFFHNSIHVQSLDSIVKSMEAYRSLVGSSDTIVEGLSFIARDDRIGARLYLQTVGTKQRLLFVLSTESLERLSTHFNPSMEKSSFFGVMGHQPVLAAAKVAYEWLETQISACESSQFSNELATCEVSPSKAPSVLTIESLDTSTSTSRQEANEPLQAASSVVTVLPSQPAQVVSEELVPASRIASIETGPSLRTLPLTAIGFGLDGAAAQLVAFKYARSHQTFTNSAADYNQAIAFGMPNYLEVDSASKIREHHGLYSLNFRSNEDRMLEGSRLSQTIVARINSENAYNFPLFDKVSSILDVTRHSKSDYAFNIENAASIPQTLCHLYVRLDGMRKLQDNILTASRRRQITDALDASMTGARSPIVELADNNGRTSSTITTN